LLRLGTFRGVSESFSQPQPLTSGRTDHGDALAQRLQPLILSAPFGNYLQPVGTTPTLGTYTAARRGGRPAAFGRALLTVRYYRRLGAWVNRIGLRNPGIESLSPQPKHGRVVSDCLLSIHGFTANDWYTLLQRVEQLQPMAVELNISCPNVGEISWPDDLFQRAVATGVPVIVKIPPVRYQELVAAAAAAEVPWLHATNTLPVAKGGMSGAPLQPIALNVVRWLRIEYGSTFRIIGGGGIRSSQDVAAFAEAGADRFAVGSFAMRPAALCADKWVAPMRAAATRWVAEGSQP